MITDNLSAHKGEKVRRWAMKNRVELCFTPTYASWANPIEARFGPLRQFTIANSRHRNHTAQTRALHAYLRWGGRPLTTAADQPHPANPCGQRTGRIAREHNVARRVAAGGAVRRSFVVMVLRAADKRQAPAIR